MIRFPLASQLKIAGISIDYGRTSGLFITINSELTHLTTAVEESVMPMKFHYESI